MVRSRAARSFALLSGAGGCLLLLLGDAGVDRRKPPTFPVEPNAGLELQRVFVMSVEDAKALGYSNNSKCVVDRSGVATFAVRSRKDESFGIALVRSPRRWGAGMLFEPIWLEDRDGVEVSRTPQRAPSIASAPDGSIHLVWGGGSASSPAFQIRHAHIATAGAMRVVEQSQPFIVTGFQSASESGVPEHPILWQEHPSVAMGADRTLHVVWEARDSSRATPDGRARPGIAYAARSPRGVWTLKGLVREPPYLEVSDRFPSQSRPVVLVHRSGDLHVFCYGSVDGLQQILHGSIRDETFSGWRTLAPSSGDQRHVAATTDTAGRVHTVWREGLVENGTAAGPVGIFYCRMEPEGRWGTPIRVSDTRENASTPSIATGASGVSVAWVGWTPAALNSEGEADNGFPRDNAIVEGRLEVAFETRGYVGFGSPVVLDEGPASYPSWALSRRRGLLVPPLVWTRTSTTEPGDRIGLYFGWWKDGR